MKTQSNIEPAKEEEKRGDDWDATYTEDTGVSPVEDKIGPDGGLDLDIDDVQDVDDSDTQSSI
jgi:hypothetical protein